LADTKNNPHFNISAAVVRQLGAELITDEVTAIMELVKNSYDADSPWVKVDVFTNNALIDENLFHNGDLGYIIIEDAGFGMNEEELRDGWMVISLSKKREMKEKGEKTPGGRTPLGDKGLGRLSTQKLGSKLEMITGKEDDEKYNHIAFNWDDFTEDIVLSDVTTEFGYIPKKNKVKGTKLIISNLKDPNAWEGKSADKFKGQLSQLIFPFKEKRKFNVFLNINGERVDLDEIGEGLRNQAVSTFAFAFDGSILTLTGTVKAYKIFGGSPGAEDRENYEQLISIDKGKNFFNFLIDKNSNKRSFLTDVNYSGLNGELYKFERKFHLADLPSVSLINREEKIDEIAEETDSNLAIANPGPFWGEIDDFNLREADSLDSAFDNFAQYKNIVKNQIGIRVFRDGFGIKPFGIDGYDWLQLGHSQTSGSSYYGLRPKNTIGFIALTAEENKDLKEKTDREGFVETPYSKNFFLLMGKVIDEINELLEKTRRGYNDYKRHIAEQTGKITNITESYQRLKDTSKKAKDLQSEGHQLTPVIANVAGAVRKALEKIKGTAPISSDDDERRKLLYQIDDSLQKAITILFKLDSVLEVAKKLEFDAKYIQPKISDLENQINEFAELAGLGLTAEALSHQISNVVDLLLIQTNNISGKVKGKQEINTASVLAYVEQVKGAINSLRKQLSHLAPSLRYVRESKQSFSIHSYFSELLEYYKDKFSNDIQVFLKLDNDFTIKMSKGKLTQIIDNIILNSEFWLKDYKEKKQSFTPTINIEIDDPFLRIYDNGIGVEPAYEQRLFQPFVTGKPKSVGRGLGLFIVQQLVDTIGCEIMLLQARNEHGRRYIFQINFSSIIQ
jgi:signal transduction histidine kinase